MRLFGVDIAKEIAKAVKSTDVSAITLTRYTTGTRTPGALAGGLNRTSTSYSTRGVMVDYSLREHVTAPQIEAGDKRVIMLAEPLAGVVPQIGDEVTIESTTLRVVSVVRDPAAATYDCQCRG